MNLIRAFVGHSFTDDDAEVVARFLKFFEQLSELHPNFTWEHAEPAEPKILAERVMHLLSDKNLFVAICTKKERVVLPDMLKATALPPGYLKARKETFYWKTSDWIIQEIGLAIGRSLPLVLLVEDGLRQPGGLQGNLEYISFDRGAPERSFGNIVEMITALSPRAPEGEAVGSEARSLPDEGATQEQPPVGDEWTKPQPGWTRRDYEIALMHCVASDDDSGAKSISDAYLATESGSQPSRPRSWEAYWEYIHFVFAKGGQLATLKRLAEESPENSDVLTYLALAYRKYQQHDQAATYFERAANGAVENPGKLNLLREAAVSKQQGGHSENALSLITQMKTLASETESGEKEVLRAEKEFAELTKDDEVLLGAMERLVDIDPSDNDMRFALAYRHSDLGNEDLALLHYSRIPKDERSAVAWNNLGVAYDQLELPAKSVGAYRTAEAKGETLAMSNIANKLIRAGFLDEAQKICELALVAKDYHKNVPKSVGRLKDIPDEEDKKETELLQKAKPVSDFYKEFGHSIAKLTPADLPPRWEGPDCTLDVSVGGGLLVAIGTYEQRTLGLLALAMLGSGGTSSQADIKPLRFRVEYHGKIKGRAVVGTVIRRREDERPKPSSLLTSEEAPKVLMILSDDANEIRVLEQVKKGTPRFYCLKRYSAGPQ